MRPVPRAIPLVLALLALLALAAGPRPGAAPIQLGETRPLETALGDTTLPTAQAVWLDMLRGARTSVDLEHFYLSRKPGEALDPVLDELGRAAARGVRVRLLLDHGMHRSYPQPADSLAGLPGIEVRRVDYRRLASGVQHAKFMIVDDREAWVGSQNLDWRALSHIHELGARIALEPAAKAIADVFETDWLAADTTRAPAPVDRKPARWPVAFRQDGQAGQLWVGASPVALNPGSLPWDRDLLLERVAHARREVAAMMLSYGTSGHGKTDSTLHRALLAAAARGVKVKLIVSDWVVGGRGERDLRALAAAPNVEVRISSVPEWSGGYIPFARVEHCKFMVTDGEWLWLGTSNWDPSYFMSSRNLGVTLKHRPLAARVRGVFETSWRAPSAHALREGVPLERRIHSETPPPGATLYGE
jgi:phosphatidylserine/phosphatidylglycerophosphate/cardiolipin synthase-like enzyme